MSLLASVVVPTYRRPELLERCIAALATQAFDRGAYEIVVADDGDDRHVRELVGQWAQCLHGAPALRYIAVTRTQGPAGARNAGVAAARGEIIAFTDDDTVPHPDWLAEGVGALCGGAVAAAGGVNVPLGAGPPTDYERDVARLGRCEFVTASCFVNRAAFLAVGGFDERFTSAWREDSDLQFRLIAAYGDIACAPRAVVEHPVRPMKWGAGVAQHRKIRFDALLYKKHPRLYRERIRRHPPWDYYAIVVCLAAMLAGALAVKPALALGAFAAWFLLTAAFCLRRLRGTSHAPAHVAEMIVTSIAIPPVAVFWRIVGALRFRVAFL